MRSFKKYFQFASIICLLVVYTITACNSEANSTDNKIVKDTTTIEPIRLVFERLAGLWQSENGKNFEHWLKNNDGTYKAVGYSIKGTDTSWNEQATIFIENGKWVFENTVKGQNAGKAVKFVANTVTEKNVLFSNPAHDFPTDINYTLPDDNTINAFIVGPNEKGGKDTIRFNFTRRNH